MDEFRNQPHWPLVIGILRDKYGCRGPFRGCPWLRVVSQVASLESERDVPHIRPRPAGRDRDTGEYL
jgi:hypothetical protein